MNIALRQARITREQFFNWAQGQDARYEFDGFEPVAMTGGSLNHNRIALNLHRALFSRLEGGGCEAFGPDAGVATVGNAVRYPDGVVTCTPAAGTGSLVPDPIVVFEVLSPSSSRMDRIVKVREYRAVESIRRCVILESTSIGLTILSRAGGADDWMLTTMEAGDPLQLPELGIALPLPEVHLATGLPGTVGDDASDT